MPNDSLKIVASNLTIAYCSTINRQLGNGTGTRSTADTEFSKEKILKIYQDFLKDVKSSK
jgi:hypothetical protein